MGREAPRAHFNSKDTGLLGRGDGREEDDGRPGGQSHGRGGGGLRGRCRFEWTEHLETIINSKASRVSTGGMYSGSPALPARHRDCGICRGSSTASGRRRERLTSPPTSHRWCPTCPGAHSACRPASGCHQPGWSSPSGNAQSYWWCRRQNAWLRGISETPMCSTRKQCACLLGTNPQIGKRLKTPG